jgi:DNA-binding CsgD family transcriptional regulator
MDLTAYSERTEKGRLAEATHEASAALPSKRGRTDGQDAVLLYGERQLVLNDFGRRQGGIPRMVSDLRAAATPEEREHLVRGMLHAIGFEWMGYGTMLHVQGEVVPRSFFTSYTPPKWTEHYFSERYYEIDPRHHEAPCSGLPLVWDLDDLDTSLQNHPMKSLARRFIDDLRDSGIRSGIFLCLASPSNTAERTVVSMCSSAANRRWIVDGVVGQALTLGLCLHEFLSRDTHVAGPPASAKGRLSPLQQEILQCLIRGLSDKEIAYRLNLSAYNVDYHLRQLRRRFAARNRVQLVSAAMASSLGI